MPKYYVWDDSGYISSLHTELYNGSKLVACVDATSFMEAAETFICEDTNTPIGSIEKVDWPHENITISVFGPQGSKYVTKNFKVSIKVSTTVEVRQQLTSRSKAK